MTARLAKRLVLASAAVVMSIAPAVLAPTAAHAKGVPTGKARAVVNQVVSSVQETMTVNPALTH